MAPKLGKGNGMVQTMARLCSAVVALNLGAVSPTLTQPAKGATIRRLYFLIHPLCYRDHEAYLVPAHMSQEVYEGYRRVEDEVAPRWRRAIATMGPHDALVLLPSGPSNAMQELRQYAEQTLGPRCVVLTRGMPYEDAFWSAIDDSFLCQVGEEIKGALSSRGSDLSAGDIQVSVATMAYARDIERAFRERGIAFDPQEVRSEGWGESFEGCVHMYTMRLRAYLRLAHPIVERFDMCVPDARFLLNARPLGSFPVPGDVRLYLWEGADGRPIGLFLETFQPLRSPRRFAILKPEGLSLQAADKNSNPVSLTRVEGGLRVPLQETFLFGESGKTEQFRAALLQATVQ